MTPILNAFSSKSPNEDHHLWVSASHDKMAGSAFQLGRSKNCHSGCHPGSIRVQ